MSSWSERLEAATGVIPELHRRATGEELPEALREECRRVLSENGKLFNGIKDEDVVSERALIPGREQVAWTWWRVEENPQEAQSASGELLVRAVKAKKVLLREQLQQGEVKDLERKAAALLKEGTYLDESGLFPATAWRDEDSKREYEVLQRRLKVLKR